MSWAEASWINNKIRIPDRDKVISADTDNIILVEYTSTSDTSVSAAEAKYKHTFLFTPKYSGTICIQLINSKEGGSSGRQKGFYDITVDSNCIYPFKQEEKSISNPFIDHYNTQTYSYFLLNVVKNTTYYIRAFYRNHQIERTIFPIAISGIITENAISE